MDTTVDPRLANKYLGSRARNYDDKRRSELMWRQEQSAVEELLRLTGLGAGAAVLDVPVGTGRFLPLYQRLRLKVTGLDISPDMLAVARNLCERDGVDAKLEVGDISALPAADRSADIVVCVRFMQHVDHAMFVKVMGELTRVSGRYLIVGIHMVRAESGGYGRLLHAGMMHPIDTLQRLRKGWARRRGLASRPAARPSYRANADKDESAVRDELAQRKLAILAERPIRTSLHPAKAVYYQMLLLEKSA